MSKYLKIRSVLITLPLVKLTILQIAKISHQEISNLHSSSLSSNFCHQKLARDKEVES